MQDHVTHLRLVLEKLKQQLFAKKSKCAFEVIEVDYLGHVVSGEGVKMEPRKILAMLDWPVPTNLKALRMFLGLIGLYRNFFKDYGFIATSLM